MTERSAFAISVTQMLWIARTTAPIESTESSA